MPGGACIVCASQTDQASPCCKIHVCHACLEAAAAASGSLFACPACRDRDAFRKHAAERGVNMYEGVPDYVETGTAQVNDRFCCAAHCRSPHGPAYDTTASRPTRRSVSDQAMWQLVSCELCGSKSIHIGCSGRSLNVDLTRWRCDDCGGTEDIPEPPVEQFEVQATQVPTLTGRRRRRRRPRDARIGRWVEVYWAGDAAWYLGRVASQRNGRFKVAYADGETVSQALMDEAFEGATPPPQPDGAPEPWRFAEAPPAAEAPGEPAARARDAAGAAPPPPSTTSGAAPPAAAKKATASLFAVGELVADADAPQHALEVVAVHGDAYTLRYRDAGAWRGQEVTLDSRRLVAFGAALPRRRRAPPPAPPPARPSAPPTVAAEAPHPAPAARPAPELAEEPAAASVSEDVLAAAPTSYDDAAAIEAQAAEAEDVFAAVLDDDDAIDDDDAPLDAFDVTEEDPFELGAARMAARETDEHELDGFEIGAGLLIDDDQEVSETNQRPGANVRRTVLTGEEARRAHAEMLHERRPRRECATTTTTAAVEDEEEEPVVKPTVTKRRRRKPVVDPPTAWASRATLPLWVVWCRCGLKACNANSREEEMWQCDRCHCWRHARCCKGESPGDCGCGRGDAARRVALAKASCESSKEDRPLADALVIRQRLAAVCAISERSPGLLPSEVVRSFSKCWLNADALAKTILHRNGNLEASSVIAVINVRKAADELRSSLQQARRVVRGDARAVAAVAAAARQLPSSEDRASFNEHARALFDRLGSVEARLKRLVDGRPVVQVEDDVAVVASFDFAHTAGSVLDSDRWCPAPGSRSIGADATYKRPGCSDYLIIRARKDHQIQYSGPPRIIARGFGDASVDVVAVDADGRARAACGLAPIQVGVLACTRLVEAEDDVLLDVVLPATHRLARQLGAKVVAAAQGPWPDHLPFSPGTYKAPKGSTSLTLDDLDAEESDEEESSDESEAEALPVRPSWGSAWKPPIDGVEADGGLTGRLPRRSKGGREPPRKRSAPPPRKGAFPSAWDYQVKPPPAKKKPPPVIIRHTRPPPPPKPPVVKVSKDGVVTRDNREDESQRTHRRYLLLAALGGSQHASATKVAAALESRVWTACPSSLRGACVERLAECLAKKRSARDALLSGQVAPADAVAEAARRAAKRKPVVQAPPPPVVKKRPKPEAPPPVRVEQRVAEAAKRPLPVQSSASSSIKAPDAWAALTVAAPPAATPSPPAPQPPQQPRAPPPPTEASFAREMKRAVASFLGLHFERGRVSGDAMARLGPKLAKALVAKHASRSSDFAFTDKVRSKVRKYVDEYVERKGAELRK